MSFPRAFGFLLLIVALSVDQEGPHTSQHSNVLVGYMRPNISEWNGFLFSSLNSRQILYFIMVTINEKSCIQFKQNMFHAKAGLF